MEKSGSGLLVCFSKAHCFNNVGGLVSKGGFYEFVVILIDGFCFMKTLVI